ncbi:hypothetical protein Tco_0095098 [Tanacetum coccineum]
MGNLLLHNTTTDKHGVPPTKRLFKVAMLDPSPNLLVHGERLEIWDYQLCSIWKDLDYGEWSTPAGLKLARENLQSRVKEEARSPTLKTRFLILESWILFVFSL